MREGAGRKSTGGRKELEDLTHWTRQTICMRRAYTLHEEISGLATALETRGGQMLDPWIIEEIKRREQRSNIEQPVVQIPIGPERDPRERQDRRDEEKNPPRGVEIIDFGGVAASYGW